ncbi:MAG: PQQ-binding-like beta-propeller repeat protein [Candidatus Hinthialibacter antarcticus]|nr:PQQ-binding-like beta-propeller repeat protein [Candidatus Hinthialibacter antarcticus]
MKRTYMTYFFVICFGLTSWSQATPTFHGNNQRTGLSPYAGPAKPELKWMFYADSSFYSSPAVGEDGSIYAASTDNFLYALNSDGELQWSYEAQDSLFSAPAISPSGEIIFSDHEGNVYSVDSEGLENWNYQASRGEENRIVAPMLVSESGQTYAVSWNNYMYSIRPNGALLWSTDIGGKLSSSPVLDTDGNIYVCTNDGSKLVVEKYQPSSKRQVTEFSETIESNHNRVVSSPAIDTERNALYVGVSRTNDGALYAVDLGGMRRKFRVTLPKAVYSSPAIGPDGTVYVGCLDGSLYAIDGDARSIKWNYSVRPAELADDPDYYGPPYVMGSPTVDANGTVYFGDTNGVLYAVSSEGEEIWQMKLANSNITAAPVITSDGVILVAAYDSTLYAVGEATPIKDWASYE